MGSGDGLGLGRGFVFGDVEEGADFEPDLSSSVADGSGEGVDGGSGSGRDEAGGVGSGDGAEVVEDALAGIGGEYGSKVTEDGFSGESVFFVVFGMGHGGGE
jgi:hypothetical protein